MITLAIALVALSLAEDIKIEVASIKPVPTDERTFFTNGTSIRASARLTMQISWAYDTRDYRIDGLPSWVDRQGWDITAKADSENSLTVPQFRHLMREVLAERFKLKVHQVTEERPVYALVLDK